MSLSSRRKATVAQTQTDCIDSLQVRVSVCLHVREPWCLLSLLFLASDDGPRPPTPAFFCPVGDLV
jgi:hypothetical protein